jgi:hypothetical protein
VAAKDKPADKPADDGGQADDAAAPAELGPYHGLEPTWVREALTDLLARVVRLEGGK